MCSSVRYAIKHRVSPCASWKSGLDVTQMMVSGWQDWVRDAQTATPSSSEGLALSTHGQPAHSTQLVLPADHVRIKVHDEAHGVLRDSKWLCINPCVINKWFKLLSHFTR